MMYGLRTVCSPAVLGQTCKQVGGRLGKAGNQGVVASDGSSASWLAQA